MSHYGWNVAWGMRITGPMAWVNAIVSAICQNVPLFFSSVQEMADGGGGASA